MKNYPCVQRLVMTLLFFAVCQYTSGQNSKRMHIGIFSGYGKDYYQRQLSGLPGQQELLDHFESKSSVSMGVFGEKFFGRRLSVVPKIYYSRQNVPTNTLCNCSHLDYLQKERHHMLSAGATVRGYVLSRSVVKLHLGAGVLTDYFLGYTEKRNGDTDFHWGAQEYNRFNPGLSGELGLQWKRIGLSGEYQSNIGQTFAKGYRLSTGDKVRRSIHRQGFSLKVSLLLTKPNSQ